MALKRLAAFFAVLWLFFLSEFAAAQASRWVDVGLSGGSGKARIVSPAEILVADDGSYTARIRFSSSSYDFMLVNGEKVLPVSTEGGSVFEIPVPSLSCSVEVQADTLAMSQPHLIDYTIVFGESARQEETAAPAGDVNADLPDELIYTGSMKLKYASCFTVDDYEGGLSLITIGGKDRYLLIPENGTVPQNLPADITVLQQPLSRIYIAATDAMDMFSACGAMQNLRFSSQRQEGWYISDAVEAMQSGSLVFAGKYSAPDYELLLSQGCDLAIENTMIYHVPKAKEELQAIGIPVLVETASNEPTPQGRMEWVRLIGLLTGHSEAAERAFERQISAMEQYSAETDTMKTVAFFYMSQEGHICVRSSTDFISQMIRMAGGKPISFDNGEKSASTLNIQMEAFYAAARNADYLIYNSTTGSVLNSLEDLYALSPLFRDFAAAECKQVYCTEKNFFQSSMELGDIVTELHNMLTENEDFHFLRRLP